MASQNSNIAIIKEGLIAIGYKAEERLIRQKHYTLFTSPDGHSWLTINGRIAYPFTNISIERICKSKEIAYDFASSLGIPVPHTVSVEKESYADEALALLNKFPKLIVKPNDNSQSTGLTLNVNDAQALKAALSYAFEFSEKALVQEQVEGEEVRFLVIKGKVKSALLRQTARVVGDGNKTIKQLILEENQTRQKLTTRYIAYPQLDASLIDKSFINSAVVPAKNEVVELSRGTMIRTGASVYDIANKTYKDYIARVERIAQSMGAPYLAVDMFIKDYSLLPETGNHWLIECNTSPALAMFYACRDGNNFDILSELTPMIDSSIRCNNPQLNV